MEMAWLERKGHFQNLWRQSLVNKQLQYTYCAISQDVKAIRQWNFVKLIENNMRKIFLEKPHTKCGRKTSPKFFSKKSKLSISLGQDSKIVYS